MLSRMSRKQLEALGYTLVESDLPAIVREWCVGDSALCLVREEFDYIENEISKRLKPLPIDTVRWATGSSRDSQYLSQVST